MGDAKHGDAVLCPLCGMAAEAKRTGVRFDPDVAIFSCVPCILDFQWPIPTEAELAAYYSESYYRDEFREPPAQERFVGEVAEARLRAGRLRECLSLEDDVLEVGAGSGAFVDAIRPWVGSVAAVEPDEDSRGWIRDGLGAPAYASVDEATATGTKYDWICLFHVLEHVVDPIDFLTRLRALLAPGGRLVIEVPNVCDVLNTSYAVPGFEDHYYQKPHLWYFSKPSLSEVLARAGVAAEPEFVQRYDLSNHLVWMRDGKPGGLGAFREVVSDGANAAYAESLIASGCADTLWVVGEALEEFSLELHDKESKK